MPFDYLKVIDSNTIQISQKWIWNNLNGDKVIIANINIGTDHQKVINLIHQKLNGKKIELVNPQRVTSDALVCEVVVEGKNLAELIS